MSSVVTRSVLRSNSSVALESDSRPSKKLKTVSSDDHLKEEEKLSKTVTKRNLSCEEWRDDCVGVREINSYALKNKILTDVTFLVGEKAAVLEAHRLILALSSPVFEAMFYGALAETGNSITIPDVEPEGFRHLLKFLYSERVSFDDYESAFKTAFAADKYCIMNLKERCASYLIKCELRPDNVWVFLENSLFLNLDSVRRQSLSYLKRKVVDCLRHNAFLEASARGVEEILTVEEDLAVEESKLLDAVLRWAEYRSSPEEADLFKVLAMPLLRHIRFSLLRANEFVHFLEVRRLKEVLSDADSLPILKHIVHPALCPLPDWCSKKLSRRRVDLSRRRADLPKDHAERNKAFNLQCRLVLRSPDDASGRRAVLVPGRRLPLSSSSSSSAFSSSSSSSSSASDDSSSV